MEANLMNFVDNLKYMGEGMLGIIAVMAIIILVTVIISKVTTPRNKQQ